MSDRTRRFLVAAAISLLLIFQIGTLVSGIFGMAWGIVSSLAVAAVSFLSARLARAGGRSSFWFLLPTLLFTVVPIAATLWSALTADVSWFERLVQLAPFMVGFGLPMIFLLLMYYELRQRTLRDRNAGDPYG
jgi:hypothetical protein